MKALLIIDMQTGVLNSTPPRFDVGGVSQRINTLSHHQQKLRSVFGLSAKASLRPDRFVLSEGVEEGIKPKYNDAWIL